MSLRQWAILLTACFAFFLGYATGCARFHHPNLKCVRADGSEACWTERAAP